MKKITCIAIDDEPLALTIIERFCQRCGLMDLSCYTDPGTGLNAIKNEKPDLVFLDIEMNGISGLEIAKNSLQKANLFHYRTRAICHRRIQSGCRGFSA